jgi:hypothetical protein
LESSRASWRSEASWAGRTSWCGFHVSSTTEATTKTTWAPTFHGTTTLDVDKDAAVFDANAVGFFVGS